jgi:hypothetical protein
MRALQRFLDHVERPRPGLDLPPHRHRAPLERGAIPSTRLTASTMEFHRLP